MEKQDIVKAYLKSRLGVNATKLMARKCEIRPVDKKTRKEFLDSNHLQGDCQAIEAVGLYYNNELVSIATVSKHYRGIS